MLFLRFSILINIKALLQQILLKCLILVETRWKLGQATLLVSYWLEAFSCGFFLVTQPMKTSGTWWERARWVSLLFGFSPKCLNYSKHCGEVSSSLWAFPKMVPNTHYALAKKMSDSIKVRKKNLRRLCVATWGLASYWWQGLLHEIETSSEESCWIGLS
jgi:hypothetical protein